MTLLPGGIHNPKATIPMCPDQTDFLPFRSEFGFAAIYMELIEGFLANDAGGTNICLTNNSIYAAQESVPELVARFAEIKRRRYEQERPQVTVGAPTTVKTIVPTEQPTERTGAATAPAEPIPDTVATPTVRRSLWQTKTDGT